MNGKMTDRNTITFYLMSRFKDADRILHRLKKRGYDIDKCAYCGKSIYNREVASKNRFLRLLERIKLKDKRWVCNFHNPAHKKKGVICDDMSCFMSKLSDDSM